MTDTSLALGSFDGLHLGHMAVLSSALSSKNPVAVVFSVPPSMVIKGKCELLQSAEEKTAALTEMGFSAETLDFSEVRETEAADFLKYLLEKYRPAKICCGFNYRFGKGGQGDTALLEGFCQKNGITLSVTPQVECDGERVSSSLIRRLIKEGNVQRASKMLGKPFCIKGRVVRGDMRGRTIGFPTVNFPYPEDIVPAKHGVYSAAVCISGREYSAVCYIGNRPTYLLPTATVETHIIGYRGDLYGEEISVALKDFIREEIHFGSLSELEEQLKKDIEKAK